MIMLCLALCFSGFGGMCLSLDRHHEQAFGRKPQPLRRYVLRGLGWLLLAAALLPAIAQLGPSIGTALWTAILTLAGVVQALLLSYRPRLIPSLSLAAPLLTLPFLAL